MNEHAGCDRIQINLQAEVNRLRVELAEGRDLARLSLVETDEQAAQLVEAEAAIARVRELCGSDSWDIELDGIGFLDQHTVLHAIEGERP